MPENAPNPDELAKREKALAEQQAALDRRQVELADQEAKLKQLDEREKALSEREQSAVKAELTAFAEELIKAGKVLPRQKALVSELLFASADQPDTQIELSDGDKTVKSTPRQLLKTFLQELPVRVDYTERAPAEFSEGHATPGYTPPQGYSVEPKKAELHRQALAFAEKNKVDYLTAALAVERQAQ